MFTSCCDWFIFPPLQYFCQFYSLSVSVSNVCCDCAAAGISLFIFGTCLSVRQHFVSSESLTYDACGSSSCFLSLLVCSEVHVSFYTVVGGRFSIFRHFFVPWFPLWEVFNWNPLVLWLPEEHLCCFPNIAHQFLTHSVGWVWEESISLTDQWQT